MKKTFLKTLGGLLLLTIFACNNNPVKTTEADITNDTISEQTENNNNSKIYTKYKFPSPMEVYTVLLDNGVKFNKEFLNNISNFKNYSTTEKLAINLGTYSADLAYCSIYQKNQQTMNYFAINKSIAEKLGLSTGFNKELIERLEKNINNPDSLIILTSNSYNDLINFLEEENQTELLPYIIFGEWIESMYITVNSTNTYSVDDIAVNTVAEQSLLFENLYDYFNELEIEKTSPELFQDVENLYELYIELYNNETEQITEKQFDNIKTKVSEIRNKWIK
jgi:hypothetical protein